MKKTYIAPASVIVELSTESVILTASLTSDGSLNTDISIGTDEYDGEFRANKKGWNSSDWSEE